MDLTPLESEDAHRALHPWPVPTLTNSEIAKYSFAAEFLRIATGRGKRGFESEITKIALGGRNKDERKLISPDDTIVVPGQVLYRALGTVPGSSGGFLVSPDVLSPVGVVESLRPLSLALRAGARTVNLYNSVAAPRISTGIGSAWCADNASVTEADLALGQLGLTPKRLCPDIVVVSRQLLTQAPQLLDALLLPEFIRAVAAGVDHACLQGAGSAEGLGILNTPGVPTVSGSSLAAAGVRQMQRTVIAADGLSSGFTFMAAPTVAEALSQRPSITSGTDPLWDGALEAGTLAGSPAFSTSNMPSGTLIGGDFSRVVIASFFDGLEIAFEQSTGWKTAEIRVRATLRADVIVEHPGAFVISTSIT